MMMNVLAFAADINTEQLDALRARCIKDVKKTNGTISFKDAVEFQKENPQ